MHPVYSQLLSSYSINDQVNMPQVGGHEFKIACQYEYQQSYVQAQFWYQTAAKKKGIAKRKITLRSCML